jgi:chromosome segregation ATPase
MNLDREKAGDQVDSVFDDLVLDLSESLDETIEEIAEAKPDGGVEAESGSAAGSEVEAIPETASSSEKTEPAAERLTVHSHGRLAALAAVNEARALSQKNLDMISEAIAGIFAGNEMSRQFLDASHADNKRANRLEIENAALSGECRRLAAEVDRLRKQCERHATQAEVQQAREEKFVQATGKLRENLHAAKLGLAEATNLLSASEIRQVELQAEVLAKGNLIDRLTRESDVLRGRLASSALEMDNVSRKLAEMRRQHDELQAVHGEAIGGHSETEVKLVAAESEASRLQKLTDVLEARLADAEGALQDAAVEAEERESRYQTEVRVLRQENQALNSRLCAKTAEQLDTVGHNMTLRSRIEDLESERLSAERQAPLQVANDRPPAGEAPFPGEASDDETEAASAEPGEARGKKEKKAVVIRATKPGNLPARVIRTRDAHAV